MEFFDFDEEFGDSAFNDYNEFRSMTVQEMTDECKNHRKSFRCESLFDDNVYVLLQATRGPRTYLMTNDTTSRESENTRYYVVQRIETKCSERRKGKATKFLETLENQARKDGWGLYVQCVNSNKLKILLEKRNYKKTKCGGYLLCK